VLLLAHPNVGVTRLRGSLGWLALLRLLAFGPGKETIFGLANYRDRSGTLDTGVGLGYPERTTAGKTESCISQGRETIRENTPPIHAK
jgi:hypothetical protein